MSGNNLLDRTPQRPPIRKTSAELTPKEQRFVNAYLVTSNAVESYKQAYNCGRMQAATVRREAWKLMARPRVSEEIQRRQQAAAEKADVMAAKFLTEVRLIAHSSIGDVLNWDGRNLSLKPFDEMTPEQLKCVKSIRQDKEGCLRVEMHDKPRCIDIGLRATGAYQRDVDADGEQVCLILNIGGRKQDVAG